MRNVKSIQKFTLKLLNESEDESETGNQLQAPNENNTYIKGIYIASLYQESSAFSPPAHRMFNYKCHAEMKM